MTALAKIMLPQYFAGLQGITPAAVSLTYAFRTNFPVRVVRADTTLLLQAVWRTLTGNGCKNNYKEI